MSNWSKYFLIGVCYTASSIQADVHTGSTSDSLDAAIQTVNAGPDFTLLFNNSVTLLSGGVTPTQVRPLNSDGTFNYGIAGVGQNIIVNGNNKTLGGAAVRGLCVGGNNGTATGLVGIRNLTISGTTAKGGDGGAGGLGAGGGLFILQNCSATVDTCEFLNCQAVGGNATSAGSHGGGGMKGNGASSPGGGGGFGGDGASGAGGGGGGGGASDFPGGDASNHTPGNNFNGGGLPGTSGVGGAGASPTGSGQAGGFGGGGASAFGSGTSGAGDFGGGGGGVNTFPFAFGGFGGGGGGDGSGGFGAGGGLGNLTPGGTGGFGGGDGTNANAGVGAGFGGAIFMMDGANLTILNSILFSGCDVAAGTGGNANTDPIANFGAAGKDIFMMSSAQITFNLNFDAILSNPIEGNQGHGGGVTTTGGLIKQGPALLALSGYNTYTGTTHVEGGELRITGANASVLTDIIVDAGAALSGTFTANRNQPNTGGGTITNSGTLSPGVNGVGTINVHDYTQTATGTFLADITPTAQVDDKILLDMTGTATLDGTMNIVVGNGNYIAGTQYTVINGTTVGTFSTITKSGPQAANVNLGVTYGSVVITVQNNQLFAHQTINRGTPTAVANAITAEPIIPNTDFAFVITVLGTLSDPAVNQALTAMSPVMYGSLEWINARNNSYVDTLFAQHLFNLCCTPRDCDDKQNSVWGTIFGNRMNNYETFDNLTPYSANALGGVLGYDYCCANFTLGLGGGYTHTNVDWKGELGGGNLQSYYGALYASYQDTCFAIDASVLGGGTENDLRRHIQFSVIDRNAKSDFWSYFVTGHLGAEYDWTRDKITLAPFGLADYHYYNRNRFHERGADSVDLDVRGKDQSMMRGEAGLKAYYTYTDWRGCVAPYIALSWVGEFPLSDSHQKANFVGRPPVMNVESYDSSQQLVSPQIGFKTTLLSGFSFVVGYKGLFNSKTSINEGEARLEWVF